jgi:hypothetical protein
MAMNRNLGLALIGAMTLTLGACASSHMTEIPEGQRMTKPESGKALVYFVRPSSFGGAIQATLYDDEKYIGTSSAKTHIPYQAEPGRHMFMVIGESADFMQAELLAGKTYYAEVIPRMGVWKARFSLRPQNGQIVDSDIKDWISSTRPVKVNEEGHKWARDNAASIKEKKAEYLPKWQSKDNTDKQVLNAGSGK